jgi:dihydroflavonol-4-reductase
VARNRTNLANLDVEIAEGNMCDAAPGARAITGVRFLFHVATDYRLWARNPQEILWNNQERTRLLMRAALVAGIERIVYTSSVATIACATDGRLADETMRVGELFAIGSYKRSKVCNEISI